VDPVVDNASPIDVFGDTVEIRKERSPVNAAQMELGKMLQRFAMYCDLGEVLPKRLVFLERNERVVTRNILVHREPTILSDYPW